MAKTPVTAKSTAQADLIEKIETEQNANGNDAEPVIVAAEEESQEEAAVILQKQIDVLKKSEEAQRARAEQASRDRDAALKRVRDSDGEVGKSRKEALQAQSDAIAVALGAAQAESESAKRDIKTAIANGDPDAQADAYERLATARANISKLEDGKNELEAKLKEPPKVEEAEPTDPLDKTNLPDSAKTWLRANPAYLTDPRKNAKIQSLHWDVLDEGHAAFSPAYFDSLEIKLGMKQPELTAESDITPKSQQRSAPIVSAPVSREAPTGGAGKGGVIRLTVAQREAAKMAGVSEAEYAKQLQKYNQMRADGSYGDQRS